MIDIQNLKFRYGKQAWLFDNLSTKFELGKIYGLLGRNGAGKTTLLKLISGLRYPHQGRVTIDRYDSYRRLPAMLQKIFMIPEQFKLPGLKAAEYARLYGSFYPKFNFNQFVDFMKSFELDINEKLTEMSYGKKKKFLISFGLATNAEVLLLDEPTNGLDIPSKMSFRKILAKYLTKSRLFVISTHQVKDIEGLIDHVKFIDRGRIILDMSMHKLSDLIQFTTVEELTGRELYKHKVFGGWQVILPAYGDTSSLIDLEVLFTAAIEKDSKLLKFLNSKN